MITLSSVLPDIPMNQTVCPFKYVVSWFLCALIVGFSPNSFGQSTLPPLESVNVPNFTIPFGIGKSSPPIREVELLVSKDRGKRWYSVARQPVESGKFSFRADSDGEYWFSFRTIMATGSVTPFNGLPLLRVIVNTTEELDVLPSQAGESGPLTPPKPERFRGEAASKPQTVPSTAPSASGGETKTSEPITPPERGLPSLPAATVIEEGDKGNVATPSPILAPRLPGVEQTQPEKKETRNLLDDLLSGMSPFMDVEPVEVPRIASDNQASGNQVVPTPGPPKQPVDVPVGGITGVALTNTATKPQVVVRWNSGDDLWKDAQIDIFRGSTKEGPWSPIAINLSNSGEYWWFLTPEDLKPFHVAVRIRSFYGGTQMDVTLSAITIDPKLSLFHGARSKE